MPLRSFVFSVSSVKEKNTLRLSVHAEEEEEEEEIKELFTCPLKCSFFQGTLCLGFFKPQAAINIFKRGPLPVA